MSNYNDYNQIMLMIQNDEFNMFINYIPKIMDVELANILVTTLCNSTHRCNWIELAMPRFNVEIGTDVLKQNLSNLIKEDISIEILRKISSLLSFYKLENNKEKQTLIDKMLDFFHHLRENIKAGENIIPGDIVFFKIVGILRKLKSTDADKVRYTLENVCYLFADHRNLDPQKILKQMYTYLKYEEYY